MKTRIGVVAFAISLKAVTAWAQLHLITGSPNPNAPSGYTSTLFRVTTEGAVQKVVNLVTDAGGTEWIAASQDLRKAVLVFKDTDQSVVVDFDKAAIVKNCTNPPDPDNGPVEHWLLDLPGKGAVYAENLSRGTRIKIRAMVLDPTVPCSQSFAPMEPANAKYLVASGVAGVATSGGYDWMHAGIGEDGTPTRFFGNGVAALFDYRVPLAMFSDLLQPDALVVANNKRLFVLNLIDYSRPESRRLLIFRKSDRTWHRLPNMGETTVSTRVFGDFIAVTAEKPKGATARESAGRKEWRTEIAETGPGMSSLFHDSDSVFPGRLYLYDASTERVYILATNQGDSEVLLVENGVVYYRASDRLYSATLTDKGLAPSSLLATSETIRDAHWAFIKR